MTSLLKAIDIFSTKFNFSIDKDSGYSTPLGSVFSIISAVVFVVLFVILGKDFLYKENARTSSSVFIENIYEKISLRDLNLTIAIKLDKSYASSAPLDLNGGFFWSDFSYTYQYYNATSDKFQSVGRTLGLQPCDNLTYSISGSFGSDYSCIEFPEESYLGVEGNDSYSLQYALYNCEKKYPMGIPGIKCNSIETLTKTFKEKNSVPYMFQIYYPVLYYDPRDKNWPAKVYYEMLSFPFDFNLQRADIFNFHKTVVNEDKGWWFEENHNDTFWTVESKDYSFEYKSNADLSMFLSSSKMYDLSLSTSIKSNYYSRSYMKIQDVLAVVATILKILVVVFEFICMLVNLPLLRYYVFRRLFSIAQTSNDKNNITVFTNHNISKLNLINANANSNVNASKSKEHSPSLIPSKFSQINVLHKKTSAKSKSYNKCFALRRAFGTFGFREKEGFLLDKFDKGTEIVKDKLDLNNYLRMIYDILILQKSLFNEAQCYSLHFLRKVNLFNQQEVDSYFYSKRAHNEEALRQYSTYFSKQLQRSENGKAKDKFLLERMKESFKSQLFAKWSISNNLNSISISNNQ